MDMGMYVVNWLRSLLVVSVGLSLNVAVQSLASRKE